MSTPPALLRVIGPPGSGKSLLMTSLVDELRKHGVRTASVSLHGTATVITLSTGSNVVMEQHLDVDRLASVVASIDPSVRLILAEGYSGDAAAIKVRAAGTSASASGDTPPFATVVSEDLSAAFAERGPGAGVETLAVRIRRELLGDDVSDVQEVSPRRGSMLDRLRQRFR